MKIGDIRDEFLLLEHMHDLDKRLLRVFELGAREGTAAGAQRQYAVRLVAGPLRPLGAADVEGIAAAVTRALR